jgi:putative transcriptional regulator
VRNLVRELRTEHGLSQGELAGELDVSRQTINSIEQERYTPSLPLAIALARFFGTTVDGGRSETIRGLRGDGRDERFRQTDVNATAFAGLVVIICIVVGFFVELARGKDGNPFGLLGAAAGLAYIAAIVSQRARS